MFGWSSTPVTDPAPMAEGTAAPMTGISGRSALTRLLIDRIQDSQRDPFAVVMLELAGRRSGSDEDRHVLPLAARDGFLQRLHARLPAEAGYGDFAEAVTVLLLPGVDTRAALEPLRQVLADLCQHSLLADRQCYSVHWRMAAALYPADGHAPCRLLRDAQAQLRAAAWSDGDTSRRVADVRPGRTPTPDRFRLPVASDPLAVI